MYTDLTGLPADQAYARGDLNGDLKNNAADFVIFREAYDEHHGAGAFDAALTGVPEPHAFVLASVTAALSVLQRQASPNRQRGIAPAAAH
jgi:hypothetical protein